MVIVVELSIVFERFLPARQVHMCDSRQPSIHILAKMSACMLAWLTICVLAVLKHLVCIMCMHVHMSMQFMCVEFAV